MKKILYIGLFTAISSQATEINEIVEKIKDKRVGVELSKLENTKEVFAITKKVGDEENPKEVMVVPDVQNKQSFVLNAIMNKKAYINGSWKGEGDMVEDYELKFIGAKGVVLRKGNEVEKVFLERKAKKLEIIVEEM